MRILILAAALVSLAAAPALAAAPNTTAPVAAKPAKAAPAAKGPSKMSACAAKWSAMSATEKGAYNTKAKGMKSKKGGPISGYNAWTGECMKKA